jgi:hypothetical protein
MSRIYKPIAVKIIIVCLLFCGSALGQQQFVEPDPNNGRPLSVLGMDGMRWEVSIQVYADTDIDVFTTQDSLIASAHSFDRNGQYFVLLYTYYKNDYPCKGMFTAEQKAKIPNFASICQLLGYKLRWLDVDTRKGQVRVSREFLLNTDGRFDSFGTGSNTWTLPHGWLISAIGTITERMRKEVQKEKLAGRFP